MGREEVFYSQEHSDFWWACPPELWVSPVLPSPGGTGWLEGVQFLFPQFSWALIRQQLLRPLIKSFSRRAGLVKKNTMLWTRVFQSGSSPPLLTLLEAWGHFSLIYMVSIYLVELPEVKLTSVRAPLWLECLILRLVYTKSPAIHQLHFFPSPGTGSSAGFSLVSCDSLFSPVFPRSELTSPMNLRWVVDFSVYSCYYLLLRWNGNFKLLRCHMEN